MIRRHGTVLLAVLLASLADPAAATVALGTTNTFESGTTEGWISGAFNPTPPVNVSGGGPAGATDNYLLLTSDGGGSAGGKLVVFTNGGPTWTGNYIAAHVTGIAMDLNNFGSTDLTLHLQLPGGGSAAYTGNAVKLAAGSGWKHVVFAIDPGSLAGGAPATVLSSVGGIRLYHGVGASAFDVAAQLGIDNVTAVPEPSTWLMLLAGLGVTGFAVRRPRSA